MSNLRIQFPRFGRHIVGMINSTFILQLFKIYCYSNQFGAKLDYVPSFIALKFWNWLEYCIVDWHINGSNDLATYGRNLELQDWNSPEYMREEIVKNWRIRPIISEYTGLILTNFF